ncbi:MAG: hypoxanthine phosphoribosyltransferase [Ardenticatenaceae bacterium]|nr:hypoxanthine phosphoribosyltransferase [Anaerolineales bacterium]MCB8920319.1 hypoxanthine phosphoribosyltransferase [Ardenticatenaceae bacterium]
MALHPDLQGILINEAQIQARVQELADQISRDFAHITNNLYLVGVLKGAFIFLADLARHISVPHRVDFMAVSSYGITAHSGEVRVIMDLREPIEGKHVILVEDIVDTGKTLNYLYKTLLGRKPASLHTCTFARKKRDGVDVPVDYLGFEIPDEWVVGYGLDHADTHRTLPFIAELKREVYSKS